MPIHDFHCRDCAARFEQLVRHATSEVRCPACGGTALEKLLSAGPAAGKSRDIVARARARAARAGHLSNE